MFVAEQKQRKCNTLKNQVRVITLSHRTPGFKPLPCCEFKCIVWMEYAADERTHESPAIGRKLPQKTAHRHMINTPSFHGNYNHAHTTRGLMSDYSTAIFQQTGRPTKIKTMGDVFTLNKIQI